MNKTYFLYAFVLQKTALLIQLVKLKPNHDETELRALFSLPLKKKRQGRNKKRKGSNCDKKMNGVPFHP